MPAGLRVVLTLSPSAGHAVCRRYILVDSDQFGLLVFRGWGFEVRSGTLQAAAGPYERTIFFQNLPTIPP